MAGFAMMRSYGAVSSPFSSSRWGAPSKAKTRRHLTFDVVEVWIGVVVSGAGVCLSSSSSALSEKGGLAGPLFCFVAPLGLALVLRGSFEVTTRTTKAPRDLFVWLCVFAGLMGAWGSYLALSNLDDPVVAPTGLAYVGAAAYCLALWVPEASGDDSRSFDAFLAPYRGDPGRRDERAATRRRIREAGGAFAAYAAFVGLFLLSSSHPLLATWWRPALLENNGLPTELAAWYFWLASVGLAASSTSLRRTLARPVLGYSLGKCLFWTSALFLAAYLGVVGGAENESGRRQGASAVLGRLANAAMGLVALPVSRNSALSAAASVSFDDLIQVHVVAAYAFVGLAVAHAATHAGKLLHRNQETIIVVFGLSAPLLLLGGARRRVNQLFFEYSHSAAAALYVAVLWHSPGAWAYVLGGLLLSAADHFLRFRKSKRVLVVSSGLCDEGRVVKFEYALRDFESSTAARKRSDDRDDDDDDGPLLEDDEANVALPLLELGRRSSTSSSSRGENERGCFFSKLKQQQQRRKDLDCDDDDDCDDEDDQPEVETMFVVKASARPCFVGVGSTITTPGPPEDPTTTTTTPVATKKKNTAQRHHYAPTEAFSFDAGQYCWVRIRESSSSSSSSSSSDRKTGGFFSSLLPTTPFFRRRWSSSWRPLYFASSPLDRTARHLVRVTKSGWSAGLASSVASSKDLEVVVDGPYGLPHLDVVRRKHRVLFAAADVGVAPCASILRSLALQDFAVPRPTRARLVWTVKTAATFDAFAESLDLPRLAAAPRTAPFSASLHVAYDSFELEDDEEKQLHSPQDADLHDEVRTLVDGLDDPYDALVFAAGSSTLVDEARKVAKHHGAAFCSAPFDW